jgi:trk system potassium uptake protein
MSLTIFYRITFWMSLCGLILLLVDFGFWHSDENQIYIDYIYFVILAFGVVSTVFRYLRDIKRIHKKALFFDLITIALTLYLFHLRFVRGFDYYYQVDNTIITKTIWVKFAIIFTFIREFSELKIVFKRTVLNPAQLFIISFLAIIFFGSILLQLPNATYGSIGFIDALFTSTSAVCVTGLIVQDTGQDFTPFGQTIILFLIQIGGLGILTFASYFSYFFRGGTSYENHLTLRDITSSSKISQVFSMLKYIIVITLLIEVTSALFIYSTLNIENFKDQSEMIFFSAFHSVSAFCNAGFSTLSDGLYDADFKYNYPFQLTLVLTFVLGGLGFPIVANIYEFMKYRLFRIFKNKRKSGVYKPWVLNINSRITLITTVSIMVVSFLAFYFMELNNTLAEHDGIGKMVTALFSATTPRTAGFNTIDFSQLNFSTIMFIMLLMWIGASPQSTGGGIKTSTFAIATLNIISIAKGKTRIEIFRREIADLSVRRAFAIISLSLIVIGFSVLIISSIESEMSLIEIAFECFSAYSTVGLSLGVTADFHDASKVILIFVMFVGRISMLSLVIAIIKKTTYKNYRYPQEEITMN